MKTFRGYTKIFILGEANGPDKLDQFKYERRVEECLSELVQTRTGKLILDAIDQTKKEVWIMPSREHDRIGGTMHNSFEGVV